MGEDFSRIWSEEDISAQSVHSLLSARIFPLLFMFSLLALIGLGLSMVYSASFHGVGGKLFWNQVIWLILGLSAGFILTLLPLRYLFRYSFWLLFIFSLPLFYLALASLVCRFDNQYLQYFPMTTQIKGAIRWLRISVGSHQFQVQPSEFVKFFLLVFSAAYYGALDREETKKLIPGILVPGIALFAVLFLILLGKDLSSTVITGAAVFAIMFFAGVRIHYLMLIALLGFSVVYCAIKFNPERHSRITSYKNPEEKQLDDAFQLWRSQLGMGGGGLSGKGYAKGVLKTYLPEAHTDFIVAVIGEELGFLGVSLVFTLYLGLCACIYYIARQCRSRPEALLCLGIATLICMQALVNIGVVSGSLPTTGITAPFLSYGGSSLFTLLACSGLIMNISFRNFLTIWQEIANSQWNFTYKIGSRE